MTSKDVLCKMIEFSVSEVVLIDVYLEMGCNTSAMAEYANTEDVISIYQKKFNSKFSYIETTSP